MLDWITLRLEYPAIQDINGGRIVVYDKKGNLQSDFRRWDRLGTRAEGISLRTWNDEVTRGIEISGCPLKFLQGHNVYGSDDLALLSEGMTLKVFLELGIPISDQVWTILQRRQYEVRRIDITYGYYLSSLEEVIRYIEYLSQSMSGVRRPATFDYGTIYFGKRSRRWSAKIYAKGAEIKEASPAVITDALNQLRVELVFRKMELKRIREMGMDIFCEKGVCDIFKRYTEFLNMEQERKIIDLSRRDDLTPAERSIFECWNLGQDVRQFMLNKRATFYRRRRRIKEIMGVDIARPKHIVRKEPVKLLKPVFVQQHLGFPGDRAFGYRELHELRKKVRMLG